MYVKGVKCSRKCQRQDQIWESDAIPDTGVVASFAEDGSSLWLEPQTVARKPETSMWGRTSGKPYAFCSDSADSIHLAGELAVGDKASYRDLRDTATTFPSQISIGAKSWKLRVM